MGGPGGNRLISSLPLTEEAEMGEEQADGASLDCEFLAGIVGGDGEGARA